MNKLQAKLEELQAIHQRLLQKHNELTQMLNETTQYIIEVSGGIKVLKDLLDEPSTDTSTKVIDTNAD